MDYKILPVGDSALTIVFGDRIDPEISRIVRTARKHLASKNIEGVNEYVQTYATLMIQYRPVVIGYDQLVARIDAELAGMDRSISTPRLKNPRERLEKGSVGIAPDSICVHGDNEKALAFVTRIRSVLQQGPTPV